MNLNSEHLNGMIGICFAAVIVCFLFLLLKDSDFFKSLFGKKKEKTAKKKAKAAPKAKEHTVGTKVGQKIDKMVKKQKGEAAELPNQTKIYYRLKDEKAYRVASVTNVPFTIGCAGSNADLELDDPAVAEKHVVIKLVKDEYGFNYCLKNLCKEGYTEFLAQDEEELRWYSCGKDDEYVLDNPREAFYVGNTKLLIDVADLTHKVTSSDRVITKTKVKAKPLKTAGEKIAGFEAVYEEVSEEKEDTKEYNKKGTPSHRTFESNVLDTDEIIC